MRGGWNGEVEEGMGRKHAEGRNRRRLTQQAGGVCGCVPASQVGPPLPTVMAIRVDEEARRLGLQQLLRKIRSGHQINLTDFEHVSVPYVGLWGSFLSSFQAPVSLLPAG